MKPSRDVRWRLCEVLGMDEDFFERPLRAPLGEVKYRKRSALGAREERAILGRANDFFERYAELEELIGVAAAFENPIAHRVIDSPEAVEAAAEELREKWGLGTGPIPLVIGLLEDKDLHLFADALPTEFDGFAGHAGRTPVVALNLSFPIDRLRLSALHELGHLVLRFPEGRFSEPEVEKLCFRFGGAMLMPRKVFEPAFGGYRRHVELRELTQLKAMYGISCSAIMMRAGALGLVAESMLERFWTEWSMRGYRVKDPGICSFPEVPHRFDLLLARAVAEQRISLAKGADLAGRDEGEFRASLEILP